MSTNSTALSDMRRAEEQVQGIAQEQEQEQQDRHQYHHYRHHHYQQQQQYYSHFRVQRWWLMHSSE